MSQKFLICALISLVTTTIGLHSASALEPDSASALEPASASALEVPWPDITKGTLSCVTDKDDQWLTVENFANQPLVNISRSQWSGVMMPERIQVSKSLQQSQAFFGSNSVEFNFPQPALRMMGWQMIPGFTGELVQTDVRYEIVWGAQSIKTKTNFARVFVSRKGSDGKISLLDTLTFNDCVVIP